MKSHRKPTSLPAILIPEPIEPGSTKAKIFAAAEQLFVQRGYYGASVREITARAGVDLARVNYHFGSKDELFRQVLARHAKLVAAAQLKALDGALAAAPGASLEGVISAYVRSLMASSRGAGHPDGHFLFRLSSHLSALSDRPDLTAAFTETSAFVVPRFVDAFERALPDVPSVVAERAFNLLRQSLRGIIEVSIEAERGIPVGLGSMLPLDVGTDTLVSFFAAGIRQFAAMNETTPKPRPGGARRIAAKR